MSAQEYLETIITVAINDDGQVHARAEDDGEDAAQAMLDNSGGGNIQSYEVKLRLPRPRTITIEAPAPGAASITVSVEQANG